MGGRSRPAGSYLGGRAARLLQRAFYHIVLAEIGNSCWRLLHGVMQHMEETELLAGELAAAEKRVSQMRTHTVPAVRAVPAVAQDMKEKELIAGELAAAEQRLASTYRGLTLLRR